MEDADALCVGHCWRAGAGAASCTHRLLLELVAIAGSRHETPRSIDSDAKRARSMALFSGPLSEDSIWDVTPAQAVQPQGPEFDITEMYDYLSRSSVAAP